ncbi:hypothetical protein RU639_006601 [Aspergillus parasiticus]
MVIAGGVDWSGWDLVCSYKIPGHAPEQRDRKSKISSRPQTAHLYCNLLSGFVSVPLSSYSPIFYPSRLGRP